VYVCAFGFMRARGCVCVRVSVRTSMYHCIIPSYEILLVQLVRKIGQDKKEKKFTIKQKALFLYINIDVGISEGDWHGTILSLTFRIITEF